MHHKTVLKLLWEKCKNQLKKAYIPCTSYATEYIMFSMRFPNSVILGTGITGRWKLWALFCFVSLIATIGTWVTGQYQIGRLDSLKGRYDQPITNYAKFYGNAPTHSLERDLLEGCKQAQIGTWLQTTDALRFNGPLTGNRVDVQIDLSKAYIDLNGKEVSDCIQDEVEDRQFDIGSMTNTWAIILLLCSFCMGVWAWICYMGVSQYKKGRNIYAETLAEAAEPTDTIKSTEQESSDVQNMVDQPPSDKAD